MGDIQYTAGTGVPHRQFEDEFLTHRECSEWWYTTGYLEDENKRMFSYQYTLAYIKILGVRFHVILTALSDMETGEHYYGQQFTLFGRGITTNHQETTFKDVASIHYAPNDTSTIGNMQLTQHGEKYALDLHMESQKPPVWQCDDGKLGMGTIDDPKEVTYYYSLTNLDVTGTLTFEGEQLEVHGKGWFDRQGGTYSLTKPRTNWEWFSLRFFDDEEIMLFYFPQTEYRDGTHIQEDGTYERLNDYTIDPLDFITEPDTDYKFSYGWKLEMPGVKDEEYTIAPKATGQFNVAFYELLADIVDKEGQVVGYCVVELLPGARNDKLNSALIFKRKKS